MMKSFLIPNGSTPSTGSKRICSLKSPQLSYKYYVVTCPAAEWPINTNLFLKSAITPGALRLKASWNLSLIQLITLLKVFVTFSGRGLCSFETYYYLLEIQLCKHSLALLWNRLTMLGTCLVKVRKVQ